MTDSISVQAAHSSIRHEPAVHAQVIAFLRNGRFNHGAPSAQPDNLETP